MDCFLVMLLGKYYLSSLPLFFKKHKTKNIVLIKFVYARLILNLNLIFHAKTVATKTRNLPEVTITYQENSDLLIYLFLSTVLSIQQALF